MHGMAHRARFPRTLLIIIIVAGSLLPAFAVSCEPKSQPKQTITIGWSPFETATLLWIAEDQKFFPDNGINVVYRKYDTGAASLNGMLDGEADIAVGMTEFPMVKKALDNSAARIVATIAKVEQQYLVTRKDRGIEKPKDLKGKTIGTTFGTAAEFYLGRYLELNSIPLKDITEVDLKTPAEWESAVADGIVDAIVTAQPYADLASKRLGSNAVVWPVQSGQYVYGLAVCSADWAEKNPEIAANFIKSLERAGDYAIKHPTESKAILQRQLNMDAQYTESSWSRSQFQVLLDQSLIAAMEDEARWMISNNLTNVKQMPDFTDFIYTDALKAVKPDAVNVIR